MTQSPMTCRYAKVVFKPGFHLDTKTWKGARFKCSKGMWLTRTEIKHQSKPSSKVYDCYYSLTGPNVLRTCSHCLEFKPATEEYCRQEIAEAVQQVATASGV